MSSGLRRSLNARFRRAAAAPLPAGTRALRDDAFDYWKAHHLMQRAGFGGTPDEVRELTSLGLDGAIARLVRFDGVPAEPADGGFDPDIMQPISPEQRRAYRQAQQRGDEEAVSAFRRRRQQSQRADRQQLRAIRRWWLERLVGTPRPLEEKMTLFWHGHFATGYRAIEDSWHMERQIALFREHALGDFKRLTHRIIRDPAMLEYLNNDRNVARRPNENLARELMELFTLGEGHYTEDDIKAGARALTGYHFRDNDFAFNARQHDTGQKTILGQTDAYDGGGFVDLLLGHPACARFVALKLYRHFVADVSDDWDLLDSSTRHVVDQLAKLLRDEHYELKPVLTRLFKSRHFYDFGVVGKQIKSPVQVVVGTIHQTHAPLRNDRALATALRGMGQQLFEPPSVAGWSGGRSWINTSTLFMRQNTCAYLLTGTIPGRQFSRGDVQYDPRPLLAGFEDRGAKAVVDGLCDAMLGHHVGADRREPLSRFMQEREKGVTADSLVALLLLITAMPEYQLC